MSYIVEDVLTLSLDLTRCWRGHSYPSHSFHASWKIHCQRCGIHFETITSFKEIICCVYNTFANSLLLAQKRKDLIAASWEVVYVLHPFDAYSHRILRPGRSRGLLISSGRFSEIGSQCPLFFYSSGLLQPPKRQSKQWSKIFVWFFAMVSMFTTALRVNPTHQSSLICALNMFVRYFVSEDLVTNVHCWRVWRSSDMLGARILLYPQVVCSFEHLLQAICYLKVYISVA
jgi:hypothetical protein